MEHKNKILKRYMNLILDIGLVVLAILILIFMGKHLIDIASYIMSPLTDKLFSKVMQEIISFFMLFEFIMMVIRYIQENHHIPIRYLILICITAILRQLMVLHGDGLQTLLLSVSILLLVIVLFVLSFPSDKFSSGFKSKVDQEDIDQRNGKI